MIGVSHVPRLCQQTVRTVSGPFAGLLAGSTPDTGHGSKYKGAPIGYSCKKVLHKDGFDEIFGDETGVRGLYQVNCDDHGGCARCAGYLRSIMFKFGHSLPELPLPTSQAEPLEPPPPPKRESLMRPRAHSLNATAETFIYLAHANPPKPTIAEIKADLTEREAKMKKELENLRSHASTKIPTGPRSMMTSRYNHETGQIFGPLTINNKPSVRRGLRRGTRRQPNQLALFEGHSLRSTPTLTIQSEPFYDPDMERTISYGRPDTVVTGGEQRFLPLPGPMAPYNYKY